MTTKNTTSTVGWEEAMRHVHDAVDERQISDSEYLDVLDERGVRIRDCQFISNFVAESMQRVGQYVQLVRSDGTKICALRCTENTDTSVQFELEEVK